MKCRLDVLLVERGLAESREKAKAIIMSGSVFIDGQRADKVGMQYLDTVFVEVRGNPLRYVSRGGLKLEKAIGVFEICLDGLTCADIGASTGGFTDCMLQNNAAKVYAIDVGYGQLAWKIRSDPRVVCLERTNARYLTNKEVPEPLHFFSVDVSFISLKLILPAVRQLCCDNATAVCLIKPQFEAGRDQVGKNGVVRDSGIHREVIENVLRYAADSGFVPIGLDYSPIKGPEGNIEYLLYLRVGGRADSPNIDEVVKRAHTQLKETPK